MKENPLVFNIFNPHIHTIQEWLLGQHSANVYCTEGESLLEWAIRQKQVQGIEGLMEAGVDLNQRNELGQGWCFWGIQTSMDMWLYQGGLRKLDKNWWLPDAAGHFMFFEPGLNARQANVLSARWWSDGLPWEILKKEMESPQMYWRYRSPEVARIFSFWSVRMVIGSHRR